MIACTGKDAVSCAKSENYKEYQKRETTMKSENNRLILKINSNNIEQNWVLTTFLMLTNVTMSLKLIKS